MTNPFAKPYKPIMFIHKIGIKAKEFTEDWSLLSLFAYA